MGLEILVTPPSGAGPAIAPALSRLAASGFAVTIMMVDGALVMPTAPPPEAWRDVRLRTPAGTVTLSRREGGAIAVLVFGNADEKLQDAQRRVADALRAG